MKLIAFFAALTNEYRGNGNIKNDRDSSSEDKLN
jgi:hypothetical protein